MHVGSLKYIKIHILLLIKGSYRSCACYFSPGSFKSFFANSSKDCDRFRKQFVANMVMRACLNALEVVEVLNEAFLQISFNEWCVWAEKLKSYNAYLTYYHFKLCSHFSI